MGTLKLNFKMGSSGKKVGFYLVSGQFLSFCCLEHFCFIFLFKVSFCNLCSRSFEK